MVELLVSIGVFSVISTIAIGGFINAFRTHRQAIALMDANNNASAAIEQMAREIRTGKNFFTNTGQDLFFRNTANKDVVYAISGEAVTRAENGSPPQKITDDSVIVKYLSFRVMNDIIVMTNHPARIVINIGIVPKQVRVSVKNIDIQTTVSSRNQ